MKKKTFFREFKNNYKKILDKEEEKNGMIEDSKLKIYPLCKVTLYAFLILVALFFSFYNLGEHSIWLDEGYTYAAIKDKTSAEIMAHVIEKEQSPPLFFLLTAHFYPILENETSLRFISALAVFLTVLNTFFLGRRIFGFEVAFLSAFFLATHPLSIALARDARMYGLLAFFSSAAALFFYSWLEKFWQGEKIKSLGFLEYLAFIIFSALALWTHFLAGVFLFSLGLFFLLFIKMKDKSPFWSFFRAVFLILVLFLPWFLLFYFKQSVGIAEARDWASVPNYENFINVLWSFFPHYLLLGLFCFLLLINFSSIYFLGKKNLPRLSFLFFTSFLPLLLAFFLSQKVPIFQKRYFLALLPFFILFFFVCLDNFKKIILAMTASIQKKKFNKQQIVRNERVSPLSENINCCLQNTNSHRRQKALSTTKKHSTSNSQLSALILKLSTVSMPILFLIFIFSRGGVLQWIQDSIFIKEDWRAVAQEIKEEKRVIVHTPSIALALDFYGAEEVIPFPNSDNFRNYLIGEKDYSLFQRYFIGDLVFIKGRKPYFHEKPKGLVEKWIRENCQEESRKEFLRSYLIKLKCQPK